jgi:hypothetical protein
MTYLQQNRKTARAISGIQAALAIACFVGMVACGEPIGPKTICCTPEPPQVATVNALAPLAAELHDAADIFAHGVTDVALRDRAESAVNTLADQLQKGKVEASREALFQARFLLTDLDDTSAIELAPVGLALNYVELRMHQILNPGA